MVQGLRSIKGKYGEIVFIPISYVKNSIGNGEAKVFACTT